MCGGSRGSGRWEGERVLAAAAEERRSGKTSGVRVNPGACDASSPLGNPRVIRKAEARVMSVKNNVTPLKNHRKHTENDVTPTDIP